MNETPRREISLPKGFYVALGVAVAACLLYALRHVLTPLFLAFAIAYVLDPLIDRFEALKLPRALAIVLVLFSAIGLVVALSALVIPTVASDVAAVVRDVPGRISALVTSVEPWLTAHHVKVPHTTTEWMERVSANANDLASTIIAPAGGILTGFLAGTVSMAGSFVTLLVVPVLSVYFLNDFDRITAGIRNLLPRRYRKVVTEYAKEIDLALTHFLRGQMTVMAIMGVLYGAAYALLGVRLALPIGVVAGILSFIPYLGSAFALLAGLSMSLLGGFDAGQLIGVVIAYTIIQLLEGFVIAPRVMGKTVGLPEMWVLIALFVGGEVFGFLGVLLAVPAAAVVRIFLMRAVDIYHESDLYLEGPASMRSIPPAEPHNTSSVPPPGASSSPSAASLPRITHAPLSATSTPPSANKTPLAGSVVRPGKKSDPPDE